MTAQQGICVYENIHSDTILPVTAFEPESEGTIKKTVKRARILLPADAEKRFRQLRAIVLRDDKQELSRAVHAYQKRQTAAEVEIAQAAALGKKVVIALRDR